MCVGGRQRQGPHKSVQKTLFPLQNKPVNKNKHLQRCPVEAVQESSACVAAWASVSLNGGIATWIVTCGLLAADDFTVDTAGSCGSSSSFVLLAERFSTDRVPLPLAR